MKVVCVGGGPAGLYFSILMKLHDRAHDITVLEPNPSGLTYGWGVVFWDDLLDAVRHSDPPTAAGMEQRSFRWVDQLVQVEGGQAVSLGGGGYGLGRQALLDLLSERAAGLGVRVLFEHEADDRAQLDGADLVVACDGVNSRLRRRHQDQLQTSIAVGSNPYVWLGTSKVFEAFTFAFAQTSAGWIWFHAYAFNDQASTFIVECAPETWAGLGFDRLGVDDSLRLLEQIFERRLEGLGCSSTPRMIARCRGSGSEREQSAMAPREPRADGGRRPHHPLHHRVGYEAAVEDAIALAERLHEHEDLPAAREAYASQRRAELLLPQREAAHSAQWFEHLPRYVGLPAPRSPPCSSSDARVCCRAFLHACTTICTGRPGRSGCGVGSGSWPAPAVERAMSAAGSDHRSAVLSQLPGGPSWGQGLPASVAMPGSTGATDQGGTSGRQQRAARLAPLGWQGRPGQVPGRDRAAGRDRLRWRL